MQCVLLTGSEGSLGTFVARCLCGNDFKIVRVGRRQEHNIYPGGGLYYKGDLQDKNVLDLIFNNHSIDYVIHCAALWNGFNSDFSIIYNNVSITLNLLNYCKSIKKFVYISSSGVYENFNEAPLEDASLGLFRPASAYGLSKLISEELIVARYDIPFVIFRPFHIVSPEEKYCPGSSHICTDVAHNVIECSRKIKLDVFSKNKRLPLVWVGDIAELIVSSLLDGRYHNNIFNVGNLNEITPFHAVAEVIKIAEEMGYVSDGLKNIEIPDLPVFEDDLRFRKIESLLGWRAVTTPQDCVRKFMSFKYGAIG